MDKKKQLLKELSEIKNKKIEIEKAIKSLSKSDSMIDKIKTFEDACNYLNIFEVSYDKDTTDEMAYKKLKIISRALNEGWSPNWSDHNEYKYYPWFYMNPSGFGFSGILWAAARSTDGVGSRLCFSTREKAEYAGKQFESIYKEYLTIQK